MSVLVNSESTLMTPAITCCRCDSFRYPGSRVRRGVNRTSIDTIDVMAIKIMMIATMTLKRENLMVQIVLKRFSLINDSLNRLGVFNEWRFLLFICGEFIINIWLVFCKYTYKIEKSIIIGFLM